MEGCEIDWRMASPGVDLADAQAGGKRPARLASEVQARKPQRPIYGPSKSGIRVDTEGLALAVFADF